MINCIQNTKELKRKSEQKRERINVGYLTAMHYQKSHDSSEERNGSLAKKKAKKKERGTDRKRR